mgnify:CR=1 FL=1
MASLSRSRALELLDECPIEVKEHSLAVSRKALELGARIQGAGHQVDMDFLEKAALLHDLGRSRTHGIKHGLEGAEILSQHPRYASVCENHVGGGITQPEAASLGLPEKDFLPATLEEKIICIADKLTRGTRYVGIEEAVNEFKKKLGERHPTIGRIRKLFDELNSLAGGSLH